MTTFDEHTYEQQDFLLEASLEKQREQIKDYESICSHAECWGGTGEGL